MQDIYFIIFLIFAGQTAGSLLGLIRKPSDGLLYASLAFAGAMMVTISFAQLLPESLEFTDIGCAAAFFAMGLIGFRLLDHVLPHVHPELLKKEGACTERSVKMLVIGIALHNLPEGLAVGAGFATDPSMGLLIAIAITIQDIPENLATIVPLYCLNNNRKKSFIILLGTAFFELAGFLLGYFVLTGMHMSIVGNALALAAGFMVYISFDELLPSAKIRENLPRGILSLALGVATVVLLGLLT